MKNGAVHIALPPKLEAELRETLLQARELLPHAYEFRGMLCFIRFFSQEEFSEWKKVLLGIWSGRIRQVYLPTFPAALT